MQPRKRKKLNLKEREIKLCGVKTNGNGEPVFKPWETVKTRVLTITAIIVLSGMVFGVFAQVKTIIDTTAKVDSLQLDLEILYATQDSTKEIIYDKNKAMMRIMKAVARAVITDKQDADRLITDVEEEMKADKEHAEEALKNQIQRIRESVK